MPRRLGRAPTSFQFPEELLERARKEAESREVPLNRFVFRAVAEYLDALAEADRTPVALKHGLPRKRVLGDPVVPPPPDLVVDARRAPRVKVTEDRLKKAG
jgi:hypothetical protein